MQLSHSLRVVCATAICIMPLALRADDTDAQAKAREALEQKLKDMQSQPANVKAPAKPIAPAAPATPAPKPKKDAVKPVPAQVVTAPAPTTAAPQRQPR